VYTAYLKTEGHEFAEHMRTNIKLIASFFNSGIIASPIF
jgi:hypothetical protein